MARKKSDIEGLLEAFKLEISRLEAKKHKAQDNIKHFSSSIKGLERQHQILNKKVATIMNKSAKMDTARLGMGDRLGKLQNRIEKLKILLADAKEV